MSKLQIVGDETSIPNLQFNVEDENKKLIELQEELQNQQIIYEQNHEELRGLLNMQENQQILYLEQLEQDINQFLEKQNYVDEEIEALKKKKRDLEDLRSQLQKEQSKKIGKNNNKILELNQKLKGLDEKLIYDQLQQCEIRQKDLEKHFINFENSELYNKCIEEIEQDQLQDQIDNRQIEQQDISIQTNQNEIDMQHFLTQSQQDDYCETQSQQQETFEKERKLKIMNLFLKKKEEKVTQCSVKIHSLQEQTENRKKKIETINKRIQEIMGLNKLIDTLNLKKLYLKDKYNYQSSKKLKQF